MQTSAEQVSAAIRGETIPRLFSRTVSSRADAVALRWRSGDSWTQWTWRQYAEQACRLAAGMTVLGVGRGDPVLLMLRNRPEFHVADMAALLLGATPVSVFNSSSPEQLRYAAGHSRARVAIVDNVEFLERFLKVRGELADLRHLIIVDDPDALAPDDVGSYGDVIATSPLPLEDAAETARPEDIATIIYTSGTTGPPKGVMLSHANILWTNESFRRLLGGMSWTDRRFVSYLPMAHIAERMTTHYDHIAFGSVVTTCPDATQLASYLREVRPHVFFGPPRVFEKFAAGIQAAMSADEATAARFEAAHAVGAQAAALQLADESVPDDLASSCEEARREVFRPALALVGLEECEMAITGAAPVPTDLVHFFLAMGLPLSEIYGLSETCGPHTWEPYRVRPGTVGPPMPGCEVVIADDGEILLRGGNIFVGYLNDAARTRDSLDDEGWLHTGDVGLFDEAGYLKIVDRKKEIIITAGGKNVSPANLEAALKSIPLVGQACVVGDGRPYLTALIVLDPEMTAAWAARRGVSYGSLLEMSEHPDVRAEINAGVANINREFSQPEQIKRFAILGDEWLPDSDELTPTLKLKRRSVLKKFERQISELYA